MPELPPRVLFGAAYYHEYQPSPRLDEDLDLMAAARFSVIRVGESVWSTWEPEDGRFDLDWLAPVLDGAHRRGIGVILGTPTYAVPPWLARRYPEIAAQARTGQPMPWGSRQEIDVTHPALKFHAERVIRRMVARYAEHPAVIGYQVDNEPGLHLLHNPGVFARFVGELRHTYGDVETLNRAWGLTYWSHRLSTWDDLWVPDGNAQPQYDLAWRRFQATLITEFIGWQADIVREYARPDQFVTTCIAYARPAVHDTELTARLDVTAGNPYYAMQDGLARPDRGTVRQGWSTTGVWTVYQSADRMFASRQEPYLVTETNATAIGGSATNFPAYDGQWRQVAWALVSRGARMIEYWHWHTLHFGTETYWGGILPHSGKPGRVYEEMAALGGEFERAGALVAGLRPDHDLTMVYSADSKWALSYQPPLALPDGAGDTESYHTIFGAFYRGAFDAGRQVRMIHSGQLFGGPVADAAREHPILVVPALYAASDADLDWLREYAAAGGHLVLGIRTGYADTEARARTDVQPARLAEAAGISYDEFSNLAAPVPVRGADLDLPTDAHATGWVDGLTVTDAQVLATYEHPHFGRWPVATTRAHGEGRITWIGTVPDQTLAVALIRWLTPGADWQPADESITATSATSADGRRLRFVHNWSWRETGITLPVDVHDVLAGTDLPAGADLPLAAWDVKVLVER